MTDIHRPSDLELPPLEDVEAVLGLRAEDRNDIPGLYDLNARRVPRLRLLGMQALLLFSALHNGLLGVGVGWGLFAAAAAGVELYAVVQWWVLRRYFDKVRGVHLGTLFLALDVGVFTLMVGVTGGPASLIWPLYLVRVGDQLWIGRRRAAAMGALGVGAYLVLLGGFALVGATVDPVVELLKVGVLAACTAYLAAAARMPWDLQGRTRAAKELILRLERQSEELDEARRRAEEASHAKSEFLARMSHELRTPLNSVMGFTNLLLKKPDTPPERAAEFLERVRQNGMHLLALINDILDIARIEEGRLDLHPTPVALEPMVRDTVAQLEGRLAGSRVAMSVAFPREMEPLVVDEARLRQVLINLLGNAIKFTSEGWIRVEVEADPDTGRPTRLSVVDTGVGIPAGRLDQVFGAFEQADGTTARRYGGTGLGLAISRALCHAMGHALVAESEVGKGSTFSILFGQAPEDGAPLSAE